MGQSVWRSKCCGEPIEGIRSAEGTSYYVCPKCEKPCGAILVGHGWRRKPGSVGRSEYRAFDECPNCGAQMDEAWTDCADDDPECDCDTAWDCPDCRKKYIAPCGAHTRSYCTERELIDDAGRS